MANLSKSTCPFDKMKSTLDPSCLASAFGDSEYTTTLSSQSTNPSLTTFFSIDTSNDKKIVGGEGTSVVDEIEQSKVHWSQLVEHLDSNDDKVAEVSNVEFFKSLQKHPTCGCLFRTFGDGEIYDTGKLEVGEKFAEGGQAELYHAHVIWKDPEDYYWNQMLGHRFVLKVFKKGTYLRDLQKQWPQGMFKAYEELLKHFACQKSLASRFHCSILCGTLLQDGRFALLMAREKEDLRTLINRKMKERTSLDYGPFPMKMALKMMYAIAIGMDRLHNFNIVHRDLKASNVLCSLWNYNGNDSSVFFVADYECSIGVVGTGFFRAPEILQAIKDKVVNKRSNVFTKAGDVYSYAMVCYEILTGKLPFEGHPLYDYDLILQGQRPEVPHHVDDWIRDLLYRCWRLDALARPTFKEIVETLEANSKYCTKLKRLIEEYEELPLGEQYNHMYQYSF